MTFDVYVTEDRRLAKNRKKFIQISAKVFALPYNVEWS